MTRRRTLLLGGLAAAGVATVGGVAVADRLDDVARELGLDPVPRPDAGDTALLDAAAQDQARLVAVAGTVAPSVTALLEEQLEALGGAPRASAAPAAGLVALQVAAAEAAERRREQALEAVSPDLARVLGSIAASLTLIGTGVVTS